MMINLIEHLKSIAEAYKRSTQNAMTSEIEKKKNWKKELTRAPQLTLATP